MGRKCDILYIHAGQDPLDRESKCYGYVPMGLIGILNAMRSKGYEVIGINCCIEKELDPDYSVEAAMEEIDYKMLLTDLHWYVHSYGAMQIAQLSKKLHPEIPVVIGGYSTTIFAEEILENFSCVDYAVTGDSDLPMEQLADCLLRGSGVPEIIPNLVYRKENQILRSKETWVQTDLDGIDFITADYFDHAERLPYITSGGVKRPTTERWICIARGCKFNCAYCCGANENMQTLFRRCNILLRSPAKVAEDFEQLERMGICHVSVSHDLQMFGKEYYKEVFSKIREKNIRPGLYLECFQLPTREYIDEILATFDPRRTLLAISPISGNEQLRRENGKYFSNEQLREIVVYLQSQKVPVQLYYTINPVGETEAQFYDTYSQILYFRLEHGLKKNQLFYQRIVLDPLAPMRKLDGFKGSFNSFLDYYHHYTKAKREDDITGFDDGGELSIAEKKKMYQSIFR